MAYLVVREPGRVAFTYALPPQCAVGRGAENDLVLADNLVSRRHLRIAVDEGAHILADLESTHGTYVNGARVGQHRLEDGDQVQLGHVLFHFHDDRPGREAAAPVLTVTAVAEPVIQRADADARRLALIFDVSRAIDGGGSPDQLSGRLLDSALAVLDCERGLVGLVSGSARGGRQIARGRRGRTGEGLVVAQEILDAVLVRRETIVARGDGRVVLAAPLVTADRVLGFLVLDDVDVDRSDRFAPRDLDLLHALAHLFAAALLQAERGERLAATAEALREAEPEVTLLGDSEPMLQVKSRLDRYAPSDAPVLVLGESGTGKELVARALHARSPRAAEPFVAVNCAAIPEALIESELFGYERGAFTGAVKSRRGKFVLAHRGTLFLDEIGDLSLAAQAKVLRAIEDGEVCAVGAEVQVAVDVRIVAATHKPLDIEIAAGRFRDDLYYRLAVAVLELPPLRQRGDDVVLLARTFLERLARRAGRRVLDFTRASLVALRGYHWPGNVRQLQNEIERALLLGDGPLLELEDLGRRAPATLAERPHAGVDMPDAASGKLAMVERQLVERALADAAGNIHAAARALGISRGTLYRKMRKHKLSAR